MANIPGFTLVRNDKQISTSWSLGDADTGIAVDMFRWADRTIQVAGTFGGATVTVEGSNDKTNWETLNDSNGSPLVFTAAGMKLMLENPLYVRASTAGGGGTAVTVSIAGAGGQ